MLGESTYPFLRWVMGVHGEAWLCCHWRPAHLQLGSGDEQQNQAELKWALGPWVGCRAQVRLAKVSPPRSPSSILSWRKSLLDSSGPV